MLLQELNGQFPMVDPKTGKPTFAFLEYLRLRGGNLTDLDRALEELASRQIVSGDGLTGGGTLAEDRTLAVGAGTGITVNADDVAIDLPAEAERVRDVMAAALVAGAGISITPSDGGDTIEVAATGPGAGQIPYIANRVFIIDSTGVTIDVNSTAYVTAGVRLSFSIDLDLFPFTHYMLVFQGGSNAAGQTISMQLARASTPTTPVHTGGNDITGITGLAFGNYNSGWLSRDDGLTTGVQTYVMAAKGSNATVDLVGGFLDVHLKIDP
jgi:hypothetical protein